jgi:hypothetical protein
LKRVFPFWTWLKQNTANQVKFIFTQPGRYSKIPKFVNALEPPTSEKLPERLKPDYFQDLWMWQLPIQLPDGTPLFFNPDFPFKEVRNLNVLDWERTILQATSPFIKLPLELLPEKGYDIFRRKEIVRYPGYRAPIPGILQSFAQMLPDHVKEKIGRDYQGRVTMPPKMAHAMVQLLPFIRNTSRMMMLEPTAIPEDRYFQWVSYMFGVKIKPVDTLTAQYYATRDAITRRQEALRGLE